MMIAYSAIYIPANAPRNQPKASRSISPGRPLRFLPSSCHGIRRRPLSGMHLGIVENLKPFPMGLAYAPHMEWTLTTKQNKMTMQFGVQQVEPGYNSL